MGDGGGSRWRVEGGVVASAVGLFTFLLAAFLAVRLGPRLDEFHTLAQVRQPSIGALWRSYRDAHDTLPPAGYLAAWLWTRVAGTTLVGVRMLSALSWGLAAAGSAMLVRGSSRLGMVVAGLVPSATALVYLGMFARPYAVGLAAVVWGAFAWQQGLAEPTRVGRWVASAGLFALACSQHYLLGAVPAVLGIVWALDRRGQRRGSGLAPGVAVLVGFTPLAASLLLVPRAVADQGRLPWSVRWSDAVVFWPSALTSAAPFVLVVGVCLALAGRRPEPRPADLVGRASVAIAVLVPPLAVGAMALTSGVYLHRYAAGALVGGSVWAGWRSAGTAARRPVLAPILAIALVLAMGVQVRKVDRTNISMAQTRSLAHRLALDGPGGGEVLVVQEYEFQMLYTYGPTSLRGRLHLATTNAIPGSPEPTDLSSLLQRHRSVVVVGDAQEVGRVLDARAGVDSVVTAEATYPRPLVPRVLLAVRVTTSAAGR